jgi:hypothetical protein
MWWHVRPEVAGGPRDLPKEKLEEYYASYLAGIFRTIRFGTGEAHGQAEMMEFNYLLERGASSGKHRKRTPSTMPPCPVCWLTWQRTSGH